MEKSSYSTQSQSSSNGRSIVSPELDHKSKIVELEQKSRQSERRIGELIDELLDAQAKLKERDTTIEEYEQRAEEMEHQLVKLRKGLETTRSPSLEVSALDVSIYRSTKNKNSF